MQHIIIVNFIFLLNFSNVAIRKFWITYVAPNILYFLGILLALDFNILNTIYLENGMVSTEPETGGSKLSKLHVSDFIRREPEGSGIDRKRPTGNNNWVKYCGSSMLSLHPPTQTHTHQLSIWKMN